jgi:hypothetical protein
VQPWGRRLPRPLLRFGAWGTGALLTLYGGLGLGQGAAGLLGLAGPPDPDQLTALRWYVFLWEPVWLVGGLLFLAAAWRHQRAGRTGGDS